jgi:hypothetical protein
MAILKVIYTVTIEETIDWPDDELEDLNYDNLMANLNVDDKDDYQYEEIKSITKNDREFWFD